MGWYINEVKNTVVITKKIAKDLLENANNGHWEFPARSPITDDDIIDFGVAWKDDDGALKLYFNDDHMEYMDFVRDKDVQTILRKHKVEGDICFSSDEGDNAGAAWGYRFDGKGGMTLLKAQRLWDEVTEEDETGV